MLRIPHRKIKPTLDKKATAKGVALDNSLAT
jgi:hypothetical protein